MTTPTPSTLPPSFPAPSLSPQPSFASSSSFHPFLKLPTELRLLIWALTITHRTVSIHIHPIGTLNPSFSSSHTPLASLSSPTIVPALLHVCHESRTLALQTYTLCFGTHMVGTDNDDDDPDHNHDSFLFTRPPRTYFSYALDTAHFIYTDFMYTSTNSNTSPSPPTLLERTLPTAYLPPIDLAHIQHIRTDWCVQINARLVLQMARFARLETFALTWFWRELLLGGDEGEGEGEGEGVDGEVVIAAEDFEKGNEARKGVVKEEGDEKSRDRPDIAQFIKALVAVRDVALPGYRLPGFRVRSLSCDQMMESLVTTLLEVRRQRVQQRR